MKAAISHNRRSRRTLHRLHHLSIGSALPERLEAGHDEPCELIGPGAEPSFEGR